MPNQPQSQANSLLNLLNPYQQSTRDVRHLPHPESEEGEGGPESPSAILLRELQGQSDEEEERDRERYIGDEREGMSPTPTPSRSVLGLGLNTISNQKSGKETTTTNSSEDGDGQPPQSLMYANPAGTQRTSHTRAEESPGPFRPAGSSSTSESRRSASTSPGPSTISNYASGLDLESTIEPTVSPVTSTKNIHIPTFREPPRPSRTISGSSKRPSSSGEGYLDPPLPASRKGKGKEKKVGGRKYHQVQGSDDRPGDDRKVGKGGLNDYEKALWKWVNVDDLDGFLQEVSFLRLSFLWDIADGRSTHSIKEKDSTVSFSLNSLISCMSHSFFSFLTISLSSFHAPFSWLSVLLLLAAQTRSRCTTLTSRTTFFVIGFSTFLLSCIDYPKLWSTNGETVGKLDDVLIEKCLIR
jgi:hypothetical protein